MEITFSFIILVDYNKIFNFGSTEFERIPAKFAINLI